MDHLHKILNEYNFKQNMISGSGSSAIAEILPSTLVDESVLLAPSSSRFNIEENHGKIKTQRKRAHEAMTHQTESMVRRMVRRMELEMLEKL